MGKEIQKTVGWYIFFCILLPKLPEKASMKKEYLKIFFFLLTFFVQIFCPKNSWFYNFLCYEKKKIKKSANEREKKMVKPVEQVFVFLA